jgi:tRNA 2-selenouridine synthase
MINEIRIADYFSIGAPLIDVRSPIEYDKGHIPGAVNIPLFTNEEREEVGTVYVRESREKAIELGLKFVNPKLDDFISLSKKVAPNGKVVVHCWRGGMRSKSFAQHLLDNGFPSVSIIEGGYKSYRNHVLNTFEQPFDIRIVGGYTGSGKTHVIECIKQLGHQALDLEFLAKHKGSAFGWLKGEKQPTVEQFENNLFEEWRKLDYSKPIWLEDESHSIGSVYIPLALFTQMRKSSVYFLNIPKEERAKLLVGEYAHSDTEFLAEAIRKITKRLGGQNAQAALEKLSEHNFYEVAIITLTYYDKAYLRSLSQHDPSKVFTIPATTTDSAKNANLIMDFLSKNER